MQRPLRYALLSMSALALWCRPADAFIAANSSAAASPVLNGIQTVNFGVGCSSSTPYEPASSKAKQPRYSYVVENKIAEFISVHFSQFNLPAGDYLLIRPTNAKDTEKSSYKYRGDEHSGEFFSNALYTKSVTLELYTTGDPQAVNPFQCMGFAVDNYRYLAQASSFEGSAQEEVCGADDSREASCFKSFPEAFRKADAVIRMLIHKSTGSFFCTGWLVGCEGHMLTNNHCISNQDHASNTEFEFRAQGDSCTKACNMPLGCKGTIRARSSQLVIASSALDYALVKLDINFSNDYGYLQMRESGAEMNERIYIPQHPAGWGKRIAMKVDQNWGRVESLTMGGCLSNQVAYSLDTQGGSSGSPVISWTDNAVVALHHCGGCPNTAVNINNIVADLRMRNLLPKCSIAGSDPTPKPTTTAPPPPATTTPAPTKPRRSTAVDGTITTSATVASIDYVDFTLAQDADVELDMLSMEAVPISNDNTVKYVDVNGDCNAGYIDSSIVLFRVNDDGSVTESTVISVNDDAPAGYGTADGSLSTADSYIFRPLQAGRYRVAVGVSSMTVQQAIAKSMPVAKSPRVCDSVISNYGSYRLTISTSSDITVTAPNTYIGSQCVTDKKLMPYNKCSYHTEAELSKAVVAEGTIVRQGGSISVDYIPFSVTEFGRVTIDVSSYESSDGISFIDVNGFCSSSYIDPIAYLFRQSSHGAPLSASDVINVGDDDDNFSLRKNRRAISFRDPFISLALPVSRYVVVVGRYPMTVQDAINKVNTASPDGFTPESCGNKADKGNYMVTFGSAKDLSVVSPGSFSGSRCPHNMSHTVCVRG